MVRLPLISVVICSYNGEGTLAGCLSAVKSQEWKGKLEIIVVDDGSSDTTYQVAKSFKGVKVIRNEHNLGLAISRNIGIKAARGSIIAFSDDDCLPRPHWIKQLYAGYSNEQVVGVGGPLVSKNASKLMQRYLRFNNPLQPLEYSLLNNTNLQHRVTGYIKVLMGLSHKLPNRKRPLYSFVGGNMSFRKDRLVELGSFDENFTFGGEDQELCRRINKAYPESLLFAPRATVVHLFKSGLGDSLRRSKAYGIGNARLSRKHRDVRPIIYPFPYLIILSLSLGFINPWLLVTPIVLVQLIYSRGLRQIFKESRVESLLYAYIQFLQELSNNNGFVIGWWKFRRTFVLSTDDQKTLTKAKAKTKLQLLPKNRRREALILSAALLASMVSVYLKTTTVLHIPAALSIIAISGYALLRGLGGYKRSRLPMMLQLSLVTALGIFWLMVWGLLADVVLPIFDVKHPLTSAWVPVLFAATGVLMIIWSLRVAKLGRKKAVNLRQHWDAWVLGGLLSATLALTFVGARLLNNGLTNIPAILAFVAGFIAIIFTVGRYKHLPKYMLPLTLFALSLAGVWSYSLRSNYVFGWDIQQEFQVFRTTLQSGKWALGAKHNPYSAMLSLTILPVMLVKLTAVSGLTIFKVLAPIFFSYVPVLLYYTFKQFAKRWIAFVAALVIIAQFYYMQQFSGEVRQQIAFLFFASILYVLLQQLFTRKAKSYLLFIFLISLVVSHYSSTYLTVIFLVGTYILNRLIVIWCRRHQKQKFHFANTYIRVWAVVTLCLATILWYGPATHSYGNLQSFGKTSSYSQLAAVALKDLTTLSIKGQPAPANTQGYLKLIGKFYHDNLVHLTYYSGASNKNVASKSLPTIKNHSSILTALNNGLTVAFSYAWWILGSAGVAFVAIRSYKKRAYRKLEIAITCTVGVLSFVAIHVVPALQTVYNPSRLNEQVLMLMALPAILALVWLLRRRLVPKFTRLIVGILIGLAFLLASGVITQYVGGKPTANLNNEGVDYSSLYVQQIDLAAAHWLGGNYGHGSSVYADDYGSLRLQSDSTIKHGLLSDITPATLAKGSYVYADSTNVQQGIATGVIGGTTYSYQFPTSFLQQNKDLVYTNGSAEVYK